MESPKKIAFVSWHNYLDQTNGASIQTRAMLAGLTERNWNLQTLCGPAFDSLSQSLEECFSKNRQIRFHSEKKSGGSDYQYSMLSFRDGSIDSVAFKPLPKSPSQKAFNRRYVDLVIVPSFHCQRFYEEVGVRTIVIPPVNDLSPFRKLSPFSFDMRKFLLFVRVRKLPKNGGYEQSILYGNDI